jgi:EmrB/QacA subfamily drug resistance transporter
MDVSIVNIALPTLSREFDVRPDTVVWASLIFNLVNTGIAVTAGRVGDLYGRKRMFTIGWVIFSIGLALTSIAPTFELLLGARAVATIGGALAISISPAIIAEVFPAAERGRALGVNTAVVGAGLATGPVLGGFLVDTLDWRAIFWIRLPAAIAALVLAARVLRASPVQPGPAVLDLRGAITLFLALASAVVACNRGQSWGWTSPAILGLGTLAVASLAAFLHAERTVRRPIFDLGLFRSRLFSSALVALMFNFAGQMAGVFLVPFYLIQVQDYSASEAGLVMVTVPLMMLSLATLSGWLADRYNSRLQVGAGAALTSAGLIWLSLLGAGAGLVAVILPLAVLGVGQALFGPPNNSGIISAVPPAHLGAASGAIATARALGSVIGLTVASVVFVAVAAESAGVPLSGVRAESLPAAAQFEGIRVALRVGAAISLLAIVFSLAGTVRRPALEPAVRAREPIRETE